MARAQNSAKGRFAKKNIVVTASGKLFFSDYSNATALITTNATGLKVAGGVKFGGRTSGIITGNSTGVAVAGGIKLSNRTAAVIKGNLTGITVSGIKFGTRTSSVLTGNSTGLNVLGGVKLSARTSAVMTGNSTGVVLAGGVKVSNKQHIAANSTGFQFGGVATKPSARSATHKWAFMVSAAGTGYICINTTGATWKYVQVTSTLNGTSGYA